ncbi:MAG: NUDIX domain-containing protein [Opitutales bacterium]|nr:NUDIX domain-containing protein [Opitutales bacterium]
MIPKRMRPVRSAARAIIIHNGNLLATKMRDGRGLYYILPGGGQEPGESLEETLRRECLEEVGVEVTVGPLLYVREYIGKNHNFSPSHEGFHQLEHVFSCSIADPHAVCEGTQCDMRQVGIAWLALGNLQAIRFYPESIKPFFTPTGIEVPRIYLGDCN